MVHRNVLISFFASSLKMEATWSSEIYFYHGVERQTPFTKTAVTTFHLVFKASYLEWNNKGKVKQRNA